MHDIQCPDCPWHDTRPSTNSVLSTCPNCGANTLHYEKHVDELEPEPLPLPAPPPENEPAPPTPPE